MTKYKTSNYNYLIDYNNKKLLFNGITGAGFCMSLDEYELLFPLLSDLSQFKENYPEDFLRLKELGYIVDEDFDEITYLKYKNREAVFLNKDYRLVINPTLECTFNCWYCYEKHPIGFMNADTIERVKNHLMLKIKNKEITSLNLSWFGGEPLMYYYEVILPLAKFAQKVCLENDVRYYSSITTNAYLIDEQMIDSFNDINMKGFQITLDGGRDRHNKIRNHNGQPSYDIILKNINLLCEKIDKIDIIMRINYDEKTLKLKGIDEILTDVKQENRDKIHINLQRVWQTFSKKHTINADLLKFIEKAKELGYKYASNNGGLTVGEYHTCYVSRINHLEINYDGKIYKCTARGYDDEYIVGEMLNNGAIKWNNKKICKVYATPAFDNEMCLKCIYLPICSGPCPQKMIETAYENLQSICLLRNTEQPIKDMIVNLYESSLKEKNLSI
ncbi:MAG: radical SAM protein [Prevotellaceae bacterium]|jgi:uncharacterized protein|nr:radical SAM protein [Prevotellaceae bacterium]